MCYIPAYHDLPQGTLCTIDFGEWETDDSKPYIGEDCIVVGVDGKGLVQIKFKDKSKSQEIIPIEKQAIVVGTEKIEKIKVKKAA